MSYEKNAGGPCLPSSRSTLARISSARFRPGHCAKSWRPRPARSPASARARPPEGRETWRNGYRHRERDTWVSTAPNILKLREGSYMPNIIEPRQISDIARRR